MKNHLIIGLGGTGGKIIREFRKSLMEQYRTMEPDGVCLGYLYVDSDDAMMGATDRRWRTLGHNVQLARNNQLEIGAADLQPVLSNVNAYPGVKGWIGDRTFWSGVLTTQRGATILGGQKRRLGRFLFSQKSDEFVNRARTLVSELQHRSQKDHVAFHVCCGLAGGTGSGCVVDVIAQLRAQGYGDSSRYPIYVYALLPDRTPLPGWDTGNYHANGIGALIELNALHVRRFKPHDLTGSSGEQRLEVSDPFNLCFVLSNRNENGALVNIDTEVPQVIASFLSAAILTANREHLDEFRRVVTAENLTDRVTPETRPDGTSEERSRKFGVFGIKTLAYPEEEIREFLTYAFARQAALQLSANHWRDVVGFVEEPRPADFTEVVRRPETQERWKCSLEHLMLSRGILDGEIADVRWRPIATFWTTLGPQWATAVTANDATRTKWMHELKAKFEEMFGAGYRTQGVREFYRGKLKAKREHAEEIRRTVERELFDGWLAGDRSLADIVRLLGALLGALQDTKERLERLDADNRAKLEQIEQRVKANDAEWNKLGPLSRLIDKDKNLLNAQVGVLQERYATMTHLEATQFAKALLVELSARIEDLANDVSSARKVVDDAFAKCTDQLNVRCAQTADFDLNKLVVTFYDTDAVRKAAQQMERDEMVQATQTRSVRVAIKERIAAGEQGTFARFNEAIHLDELLEVLEETCEHAAELAHAQAVSEIKDASRLLGVNIVDKLHDRFGARDDDLTQFVHDLTAKAGRYGTFNASEQSQQGKGLTAGAPPTAFAVLLPQSERHRQFRAKLAELFIGATAKGQVKVFESSRANEITLITVSAGFPLRFLDDVTFLRDRYDRRVASNERARIEVHLEGDGTQHPPLFLPKPEEVQREMRECLLLAEVLQLVQHRQRGSRGERRLVRVLYDDDGDERDAIDLGADFFDAAERATSEAAVRLRADVEQMLQKREFRSEEQRTVLRKLLSERTRAMRDALDGHEADQRDMLNAALQDAKRRLQLEAAS